MSNWRPSNSVEVFAGLARREHAAAGHAHRTAILCGAPVPKPAEKPALASEAKPQKKQTLWYLLDPKRCCFEYRESPAVPYSRTEEIKGVFKGLWLEWFEGVVGRMGKPACYCAHVFLINETGDPILAKVSGPVPYYVLAFKLMTLRKRRPRHDSDGASWQRLRGECVHSRRRGCAAPASDGDHRQNHG